MLKVKNLVVGCGLSGAILAEKIANELKEEVLIIDSRTHIAGTCFDYSDNNGIIIHKYGPHIFHTDSKKVWEYLSRFTEWNPFFLKPKAVVDGLKINLPFNLNSIYQVFPKNLAEKLEIKLIDKFGYGKKISILDLRNQDDKDLKFLAEYVFENIFKHYSEKQWGIEVGNISSEVLSRVPVSINRDDRYFQDKYQAIPLNGYTKMIENILDNPLIKVELNLDFKNIKNKIEYERLFWTGSIDEFFDYEFGVLPYRSLKFDVQEKNLEYYQETVVVNYPNNYDWTRICEHKYFLNQKTNKTVISFEYPEEFVIGKNDRVYPIETKQNLDLYKKYLDSAKDSNLKNIYFFGRLGDYKYYNMDLTIRRAFDLFEKIFFKKKIFFDKN
jgi:UDP-galactopyranose mutase